ncbi:hypothetical protein [Nonomuraea sp. NPDC050202]|uniref:hypothetical protein n=1 Tax=Nonomuraea sp. NPDC050202 TaxID=3155035 RepID=UPI0033F40AD8
MTTIDPSTTPAEAAREGLAKQAHDFFALAMTPEHLSMWTGNSSQLDYENGVQAIRDAIVGQGYAMLAARDELADIAASLRTLAATPTAVQNVAFQVANFQETVDTWMGDLVEEVRSHTNVVGNGVTAVREHAETVNDALGNVAGVIDRVRWWQWRRRWFNRRLRVAAVASEPGAHVVEASEGGFR